MARVLSRAAGHGLRIPHCPYSHRLRETMTPIMKTTHPLLARVGQVNKATLAT